MPVLEGTLYRMIGTGLSSATYNTQIYAIIKCILFDYAITMEPKHKINSENHIKQIKHYAILKLFSTQYGICIFKHFITE